MEPPRTTHSSPLIAPGASSPDRPARRLPAVDERLVAPESHAEILDGRVYRSMGANPPHATQHAGVTHVFAGVLADGYSVAVDMLTRADDDSDAAPDVSVFPSAPDAQTGGRQIEEIAFEVLDTERLAHATAKVEKFARRGVRRLFAVRVAAHSVYEWDHEHHDWTQLETDAHIVDRCFLVPVPAGALIDRVLASDTVARALLASRNRVIEGVITERVSAGEAAGEARGRAIGEMDALASAVLRVLARRGVSVDDEMRARIAECDDRAVLEAWLDRAAVAARVGDVFDD